MTPSYVKPYVKRQKNDAADAEAICEAVTRPTMRFVEIKSGEQQSIMVLHRVRLTLMRQRIQLSNTIRGHMAEYGLVAPVGRNGLAQLITIIGNCDDVRVPDLARDCLAVINVQILETDRQSSDKRTCDRCRPAPDGGAGRGTGNGERNRSSGS
ncbi:transposase [Mesorhizobium sp. M1405]|uniref:IS110 family transposase n=1 Tax=Mesorhizobium sp. M1405 TaxID=2957098 RepID=UPI00333D2585